jgi:phosphate transport system substrate-binding protein
MSPSKLQLAFLHALLLLTATSLGACASGTAEAGTPAEQTIVNKGSDTMVNLALAWAERYQSINPGVQVAVTGGGSGTGIAALINGTVDIANASREIKPEELAAAAANGINAIQFIVARDAIAIVVHPDNPVSQLSIGQLSDIYAGKINNWSEVGGEDRPIVRLSRETNSGTHVFFLEAVVRQGNADDHTLFATDTLLLPSSEGITAEVRQNPNAIGYDGLGYVTPDVKVIAVAKEDTGPYILPSAETVHANLYPVARDLYMYTAGEPKGEIAAYLEWIMGEEAQRIVAELGFVPLLP